MIRKNIRSCRHGNYMKLFMLISNMYKTLCFADHQFEAVSAVKLLQYILANLNLKGISFLYTLYIVQIKTIWF